jgi:hypothetical protein
MLVVVRKRSADSVCWSVVNLGGKHNRVFFAVGVRGDDVGFEFRRGGRLEFLRTRVGRTKRCERARERHDAQHP